MRSILLRTQLPDAPWDVWARRVVLHVPHYFSYDGEPTSGGRQRKVRDLAKLIREDWGRECVVVQKGRQNWERVDPQGTPVIGVKARLDVYGDPGFGNATARMLRKEDAIIYMGGEDAWPFFVKGAKGFHVGIWWDGPFSTFKKWATGVRTRALFCACRSVLCVDTNVINWLRAGSRRNQEPANRAIYVPNYVDLNQLSVSERTSPESPLRLLFARRFERKRGPGLALDAVALLVQRGFHVRLLMATAQGQTGSNEIRKGAQIRGIDEYVETYEKDLDSIFSLYRRADVALVPTLWSEGTSYSCVEALAAGLPVVTTTVGGLPNLVVPGFNGFVTQPKPKPFAEAIVALTDPDVWRELHRNCLSMREALSKDTWEKRVIKWLKS